MRRPRRSGHTAGALRAAQGGRRRCRTCLVTTCRSSVRGGYAPQRARLLQHLADASVANPGIPAPVSALPGRPRRVAHRRPYDRGPADAGGHQRVVLRRGRHVDVACVVTSSTCPRRHVEALLTASALEVGKRQPTGTSGEAGGPSWPASPGRRGYGPAAGARRIGRCSQRPPYRVGEARSVCDAVEGQSPARPGTHRAADTHAVPDTAEYSEVLVEGGEHVGRHVGLGHAFRRTCHGHRPYVVLAPRCRLCGAMAVTDPQIDGHQHSPCPVLPEQWFPVQPSPPHWAGCGAASPRGHAAAGG